MSAGSFFSTLFSSGNVTDGGQGVEFAGRPGIRPLLAGSPLPSQTNNSFEIAWQVANHGNADTGKDLPVGGQDLPPVSTRVSAHDGADRLDLHARSERRTAPPADSIAPNLGLQQVHQTAQENLSRAAPAGSQTGAQSRVAPGESESSRSADTGVKPKTAPALTQNVPQQVPNARESLSAPNLAPTLAPLLPGEPPREVPSIAPAVKTSSNKAQSVDTSLRGPDAPPASRHLSPPAPSELTGRSSPAPELAQSSVQTRAVSALFDTAKRPDSPTHTESLRGTRAPAPKPNLNLQAHNIQQGLTAPTLSTRSPDADTVAQGPSNQRAIPQPAALSNPNSAPSTPGLAQLSQTLSFQVGAKVSLEQDALATPERRIRIPEVSLHALQARSTPAPRPQISTRAPDSRPQTQSLPDSKADLSAKLFSQPGVGLAEPFRASSLERSVIKTPLGTRAEPLVPTLQRLDTQSVATGHQFGREVVSTDAQPIARPMLSAGAPFESNAHATLSEKSNTVRAPFVPAQKQPSKSTGVTVASDVRAPRSTQREVAPGAQQINVQSNVDGTGPLDNSYVSQKMPAAGLPKSQERSRPLATDVATVTRGLETALPRETLAPATGTDLPQLGRPVSARSPELAMQLAERFDVMVNSQLKRAAIRMNPAHLGELSIEIEYQDEGARVAIQTANAQSRELLDLALPRLRELMEQSGLKLQDAQVGEQRREQAETADRGAGDKTAQNTPSNEPHGATLTPEAPHHEPRAATDQIIDTYV